MKILVAVDGSPYTKRMLAYLAAHDEWLGAHHDYTVVTVVPPVVARAAAVIAKDVLKAHHEDEAQKVFKPIRAFFERQGLKATFVTRVGDPAAQVAATANKGGFDLLVFGSHGHGRLTGLVLGSVVAKCLAQTKVPVLIVR
ncbi:MAG TPA: universal stress protein [Burkholderiaceae bacterium]|nr:universal stress protein [Burkholderiaceae bacterium]